MPSFSRILLVFFLCWGVYLFSPVTQSLDSRWTVLVADSLLREGNLDLNEYSETINAERNSAYRSHVVEVRQKIYPFFPVMPVFFAVPFTFAYDHWPALHPLLFPGYREGPEGPRRAIDDRAPVEKSAAALIAAITMTLLFSIISYHLPPRTALILVLTFAFGTSIYSVASRSLWQHGPSILFLTLALRSTLAGWRNDFRQLPIAGAWLAFAFFARPTNAIACAVFAIYVFYWFRPVFRSFMLHALVVTLAFSTLHFLMYHSPVPPYFAPNRLEGAAFFWEALLANLFSPNRGLFIFSPFLLPVLVFFFRKKNKETINAVLPPGLWQTALLIFALHTVLISTFPHWWAGYSYGPRFMTDMLPILFVLSAPYFHYIFSQPAMARDIFTGILVLSVVIHGVGAWSRSAQIWNRSPESIDQAPERVWDVQDLQFLSPLTR